MVKTAEPVAFDGFPSLTFGWFAGLAADNSKRYFALHRQTYDRDVRGALEALLEGSRTSSAGASRCFASTGTCGSRPTSRPTRRGPTAWSSTVPEAKRRSTPNSRGQGCLRVRATTPWPLTSWPGFARRSRTVRAGRVERAIAGAEMAGVEIFGEALKTAPRGYPRDHPRLRLLRHRSLIAGRRAAAGSQGIGRDAALRHTRDTWSACAPMAKCARLDANVAVSELPLG